MSSILFDSKSRYITAILTFCVWPFKCQVPAVAKALFNLNAHYGTTFSLLDKEYVHLMGLC